MKTDLVTNQTEGANGEQQKEEVGMNNGKVVAISPDRPGQA